MGNKCYYSIHCIFHVFIFISDSSSCVQSLTVCDLTDWVRTESHYFCLHFLCLKFLRCTIDGTLKGKSWDFQETVEIVELYQSRLKCVGILCWGMFFAKYLLEKSVPPVVGINPFKWYLHWNSMNWSHWDRLCRCPETYQTWCKDTARITRRSVSPPVKFQLLQFMFDVKTWMSDNINDLTGHIHQHQFKMVRNKDGKAEAS